MGIRSWLVLVFAVGLIAAGRVSAQAPEAQILEFFKTYDAAFNAKDLDKLGTLYHPDVTVFEGSGIDRGWADYRDTHLGRELKSFQNLQWAHSNVVVHALGEAAAYVTADYSLKAQAGERTIDSGGIATHVLVREGTQWKIRHSHTAARRRAPGGGSRGR
jgi:ketosteroid isomerase-like protein